MSKNDLHFTDSHEWVLLEGKIATVGISEYAKKELGEIVALELPRLGGQVIRGEEVCVLESTKAAADVYAPLSGKIVALNSELINNLELLNQDPQGRGWLFQIEIKDLKEQVHLLTSAEYQQLVHPPS